MGRYVILLFAPVIVGVLIAAGVVVINGLHQRRFDARRALLETRRLDRALSPAGLAAGQVSSELTPRRSVRVTSPSLSSGR
jgi:hypothetical protein